MARHCRPRYTYTYYCAYVSFWHRETIELSDDSFICMPLLITERGRMNLEEEERGLDLDSDDGCEEKVNNVYIFIPSMSPTILEPPRIRVKELYKPCYLCEDVVREGSMRFDVLEPPRTSAYCTLHTLYPLKREM